MFDITFFAGNPVKTAHTIEQVVGSCPVASSIEIRASGFPEAFVFLTDRETGRLKKSEPDGYFASRGFHPFPINRESGIVIRGDPAAGSTPMASSMGTSFRKTGGPLFMPLTRRRLPDAVRALCFFCVLNRIFPPENPAEMFFP